MSDEKRDYRGGDVVLGAGKPRGLPFLKPLYGLPPYQYVDDVVLYPETIRVLKNLK